MSIMEPFLNQILLLEQDLFLFTLIPLTIISVLLAYYYFYSTLKLKKNKRSYLHEMPDSSLTFLKYVQNINFLDQFSMLDGRQETSQGLSPKSFQEHHLSKRQHLNGQVSPAVQKRRGERVKQTAKKQGSRSRKVNRNGKHGKMHWLGKEGKHTMLPTIEEQGQY